MVKSIAAAALLAIAACPSSGPDRAGSKAATSPEGSSAVRPGSGAAAATDVPADGVAYFAGGCFWGVEYLLEKIDGVVSVESGYMGGHLDEPTYEQVTSKTSGHLETVRVRYQTERVSFEPIARRFFEIHDPTQADGQGPDIGPQYRSAVFYTSPEQKQITEKLIAQLRTRGYDVVTELRPATRFWPAEDYHQDYYQTSGKKPYCHAPVPRFE